MTRYVFNTKKIRPGIDIQEKNGSGSDIQEKKSISDIQEKTVLDPTLKKKTDPYQTFMKKTEPDPTIKKKKIRIRHSRKNRFQQEENLVYFNLGPYN